MTPIHSILAATDLSPLARHAVVRAALVAAELGARLALQHVVNVGALDALPANAIVCLMATCPPGSVEL